jgi:hypothetical protein
MNGTKNKISFEQAALGGLLKRHRLIVPTNQREYAWEEKHVEQLFQDFAKAINDNEIGYFLGTIVTIPRDDGTLEVVDGQQRLATTAILLAAIRDHLITSNPLAVESINNDFLTGIDIEREVRVPRLILNLDDRELFAWVLTRAGNKPTESKPSHYKIMSAFKIAQKFVKNIVAIVDVKEHGDVLKKWISFVEHRALAVLVTVASGANAYKMFETLNDRGLEISQADLIKNFLFGRSGDRLPEVQMHWAYMRNTLESLAEDNLTVKFLRHALIVMRGNLRQYEVYDVVQQLARTEQQAIACASNFSTLSNAYIATFNPESDKWNGYPDSVGKAIRILNLLDIQPFRSLQLAVSAKFDKKETALAYQFLVSLGVRLIIASGTRSGSIEESVASAAFEIYSGNITSTIDLKKKITSITPNNEEFKESVENHKVSKAKLARYYLRSLEMTAKGEPEPYFEPTDDRTIINLEHILPKNPLVNWSQFTPDEADLWINRLGNQLLMRASDNSNAKSDGFDDKKALYANSPYLLTKQVSDLLEWTPSTIAARQKGLAELAVKTWPI